MVTRTRKCYVTFKLSILFYGVSIWHIHVYMPNKIVNCAVCSCGNGIFDIPLRIQKRDQLNVGSLNVDSRTENRPSLSDCVIRLTAVRRSGH